jgi:hypothetical protein
MGNRTRIRTRVDGPLSRHVFVEAGLALFRKIWAAPFSPTTMTASHLVSSRSACLDSTRTVVRRPQAGFLVRVYPDPCLILRAQISALL